MIIQHNMLAEFANRQHNIIQKNKSTRTERLSSGYRINRAADDAAGLSISEKMRGQIRGLTRAAQNVQDGISFVQTGEGALNEVHSMLQRIRELCVQAANDTYNKDDRVCINDEVQQLKEEIQRIFDETQFNTIYIFRAPYIPTVSGDPNDYKFFNIGTDDPLKTGGVMINNYRYTYDELGVPLHSTGEWHKTFTDATGELVSLYLPADSNRDKLRRIYLMSANDQGILINHKLAGTWGGTISQSGDTYSFKYNNMEISFNAQSGASREEVISRLQSDGLTSITWHAVPDVTLANISVVNSTASGMTLKATNTNKHDIEGYEFKLVADDTGMHIEQISASNHNAIVGSIVETQWENFSDITTGNYPIADWGMPGEDHDPVTLDDSATYRFTDRNTYDGEASKVQFTFSFSYDEVGKEIATGVLSTPLESGMINAPIQTVEVTSSNSPNVRVTEYTADYRFQVDKLLRDFGADGNELNPMQVTVTREMVVDDPNFTIYQNRRELLEAYVAKITTTTVTTDTSWNKTYTLADGSTIHDTAGLTIVSGLPSGNFNDHHGSPSTTTNTMYELNNGQRERTITQSSPVSADTIGNKYEGEFIYLNDEGIECTGNYKYTENLHTVTSVVYRYDSNNYYKTGDSYSNANRSGIYIYGGDDSNADRDINGDFYHRVTSSDTNSAEQRYIHYGSVLKPDMIYELAHYEYTVRNSSGAIIMTGSSGKFIDTSGNVRDSAEDIAHGPTSSVDKGKNRVAATVTELLDSQGRKLSRINITSNLADRDIVLTSVSDSDNRIVLHYNDQSDTSGTENSSTEITYTPSAPATRSFTKKATIGGSSTETHYSIYQPDEPIKELNIQAGPNTAQAITLRWNALTNSVIGIAGINTLTRDKADACITDSDVGITFISRIRSYFGAMQNRMEHTYDINMNTAENTQAAESLIRDANMAKEMVAFSASDILAQAAQALISQANQQGQGVLELLR